MECLRGQEDIIYNKFNLCVLPTQMGKTFVIVNKIMESLDKDKEKGHSIHIVFTMNTLLNNKQFSNRLKHINDIYGDNAVCIFASVYKGEYRHISKAEHLFKDPKNDKITPEMPRVIIACSNNKRFNDCFSIIHKLNEGNTDVKRVFVYFDELHKYIKNSTITIRKHIENLNNLTIIEALYGMSASPNNIWSANKTGFWSKIRILQINDYYDNDYMGYEDINFICDINESNKYGDIKTKKQEYIIQGFNTTEIFTINFIKNTLVKYPNILSNSSRVFIPVNIRRISHNYIREHLFNYEKSCIIIMLNGIEKNIQYKNEIDEIITIPLILNKGELGDLIADHIDTNKLKNRPIVYIGFNCVGMGQTLITERLGNFTAAIFGYNNILNDTMYQLFGRITGRFKNWKTYNSMTNVYCTQMCKNICCMMEKCAKNIICNHNGKELECNKYLEPFSKESKMLGVHQLKNNFELKDIEYFELSNLIDSIPEVSKVLSDIFGSKIELKESGYFLKIDGYYISKYLKKYYHLKHTELKGENRLTKKDLKNINSTHITNQNKTFKYIVLPIYDTLESKECKYYIMYSI